MKSPFTQFQGGGIEPNPNIAATGRFLGEMAMKSFADAGENMAEGLKAYQKNAAEDDYLTESLSVKAAELSKWAGIVSQDPKYAPMLEGLMPMMEKAAKGPTMSLNQKKSLDVNLGAFLKAIPDDLTTIDKVASVKEKQLAEEAEAGATAQALEMIVPQLNNPQNQQFFSQGKNAYDAILNARTPAEKRAAVVRGKQFANTIGPALQLREQQLAQQAAGIAGSPEVIAAANAATYLGESTKGIGAVPLTDSKGMPLSPQQAIAAFDAKVEEAKKANPNYVPDENARLQFLGSAVQGIQASEAPQAVKDEWSRYVSMYAGELATKGTEMEAVGKQTYGGYGTKTPASALTSKPVAVISEGLKAAKEAVDARVASFEGKTPSPIAPKPSKLPVVEGKVFKSPKEELTALVDARRENATNVVRDLSREFWKKFPDGNDAELAVFVAEGLRSGNLVDIKGGKLIGGAAGSQAEYDALIEAGRTFVGGNADERQEFETDLKGEWTGLETGGLLAGGAGAIGAGALKRYGPAKLGIGAFGTNAYRANRQARFDAIIQQESAFNKAARIKDLENKNAIADLAGKKPLTSAEITALEEEVRLRDAWKTPEAKTILENEGVVMSNKSPATYDAAHNPKFATRTGIAPEKLVAARAKIQAIANRSLSPTAGRLLVNQKIRGNVTSVAATLIGSAAYLAGREGMSDETPIADYKQLWRESGPSSLRLKELETTQKYLTEDSARINQSIAAEVAKQPQGAAGGIKTPMSLPVQDILRADLFRAATREDAVTRTTAAINSTFGFSYSDAKSIAEKFNPISSTPQVISMAGREFLATPDAKTGKTEYKELSEKQGPDSMWFANLAPTEVTNPDGSKGFTMSVQPRVLDRMAVAVKYPPYYTAAQKEKFDTETVTVDQALLNIDTLLGVLENNGIRLTNREAAASAAGLAAALKFGAVKSLGTPPISNLELEEIGRVTGTEDINAILTMDKTNIVKLKQFRDALKSNYIARIKTMGGNKNSVSFLDQAGASPSNSATANERNERNKRTYGTSGK